jgi:hypothetical protein
MALTHPFAAARISAEAPVSSRPEAATPVVPWSRGEQCQKLLGVVIRSITRITRITQHAWQFAIGSLV